MGIPRFFVWVQKRYPDVIKVFNKQHRHELVNQRVDHLYIDLNGVIHPCAQRIFGYGTHKRWIPTEVEPTVELVYAEVESTICNLVAMTRPRKTLGLFIDGVAGYSKSQQQRHRRFRSAGQSEERTMAFDPNGISPGTEFMDGLSKYLTDRIQYHLKNTRGWERLRVLWSDSSVPGEGEHKVMRWLRKGRDTHRFNPDETHVIHGLDADMFMLSIATFVPNILLLREDHWNPSTHYLVSIDALKQSLVSDIQLVSGNEQDVMDLISRRLSDVQNITLDFVVMGFMIGNDFIPRIPTVEIAENALETLIEIYSHVFPQVGRLTQISTDSRGRLNVSIRWEALYVFMKELAQREEILVHLRLNEPEFEKSRNLEYRSLLNSMISVDSDGIRSVNLAEYRKRVAKEIAHVSSPSDIQGWCGDYVEMFDWIVRYYVEHIPSWDHFFPYGAAPFASDIVQYIDAEWWAIRSQQPRLKYAPTSPPTALEQLLSVLPSQSKSLIPRSLQYLMIDSENSPIIDLYPVSFQVNREFSVAEWEGHVMIPPVDPNRLHDLMSRLDLRTLLNRDEYHRLVNQGKSYSMTKHKTIALKL